MPSPPFTSEISVFHAPFGALSFSVTSYLPVASTEVAFSIRSLPREPNSPQRFMEATTSSAVISLPLWNITPWRSVMTMVLPPSSSRSLSASIGCGTKDAS